MDLDDLESNDLEGAKKLVEEQYDQQGDAAGRSQFLRLIAGGFDDPAPFMRWAEAFVKAHKSKRGLSRWAGRDDEDDEQLIA